MKQIDRYINEKLTVSAHHKLYNYFPENLTELSKIIYDRVKMEGNNADLNDIDVSKITSMSTLFTEAAFEFNGDISQWDVSNVTNMNGMFSSTEFNGDISQWNVSNVTNMNDIFYGSPLEKNPPKWYKK